MAIQAATIKQLSSSVAHFPSTVAAGTAPARAKVSSAGLRGYVKGRRAVSMVVWSAIAKSMSKMIPDDFYDWQDESLDADASDNYAI